MKVLFVTLADRGLRVGGVRTQIEQTAPCLRELGVEVRLYSPWEDSLLGVDLCHIFQAHWSCHPFFATAKRRGIPVVITPIYIGECRPAWFVRHVLHYACRVPGFCVSHRFMEQMIQGADALLALGEYERQFLLRAIPGLDPSLLHIVPNGVEDRFARATPEAFIQRFGFAPDVLFVGRVDENKNLLTIINAIRGTGLRLAVIGSGEGLHDGYYEQCRKAADASTVFVGRLAHEDELLASAYAASKVFVMPSHFEVFGISAVEAALAGCRIVITNNGAIRPVLGDDATYADPRRPDAWRRAILEEHKGERNCALSRRLLAQFTWPKIAGQIFDVYKSVLSHRH
jgi:glycosyltransferase involved in cell wall biosynthesis